MRPLLMPDTLVRMQNQEIFASTDCLEQTPIPETRSVTWLSKTLREPVNEMSILRYHPNGGWITMITNNVMLRFAGQIATRFLGANYRSVGTFDEAVETICRIDPGIADALQQSVPTNLI